jgi:hypothetical protein
VKIAAERQSTGVDELARRVVVRVIADVLDGTDRRGTDCPLQDKAASEIALLF